MQADPVVIPPSSEQHPQPAAEQAHVVAAAEGPAAHNDRHAPAQRLLSPWQRPDSAVQPRLGHLPGRTEVLFF